MNFDWSLPPGEPVAVAISGGADSFALLHVLHEKNVPIVGLTVDHGLRPEAADEAAKVAEWCAARGISHEILRWDEPPKGGVQAAARAARYRLLCEACNRLDIETLVTGHTADDQAETVFMRLRRGSGRGLAAMPEQRLIAGGAGEPVTLYRPMLGVRRAETLAFAEAHELPISNDPSNEDDRYERVRIRALLAALEQQDLLTVEALCLTSNRVRNIAAMVLGSQLDDELGNHEHNEPLFEGPYCTPDGAVLSRTGVVITEVIWRMIFAVSGRYDRKSFEIELPSEKITIEGVTYIPDHFEFERTMPMAFREPAALLGRADGAGGFEPIPVSSGEKHLYDRRFIVHVPEHISDETHLKPLGALMPRDIATSTLDRQRISTLPCLSRGDHLSHIPAVCEGFVRSALSGWKRAEDFLDGINVFTADSLLEERFTSRVIRF